MFDIETNLGAKDRVGPGAGTVIAIAAIFQDITQ